MRCSRSPSTPTCRAAPQVLMMLERLYRTYHQHPGVRFVTMNEMADDFAQALPAQEIAGIEDRIMCSLCGVLGGSEHWADAAARARCLHSRNADPVARRRERMKRVRLANEVLAQFGLTACGLAGRSLPAADAHRQDRNR